MTVLCAYVSLETLTVRCSAVNWFHVPSPTMLGLQLFSLASWRHKHDTFSSFQFRGDTRICWRCGFRRRSRICSHTPSRSTRSFCSAKCSHSSHCLQHNTRLTVHHHRHHHLFAQINWTTRRTRDQHENKSRTRKAQKTGAYILPIKKNKHTRYKNNYDYAYRKNAEKSTRLSDRLHLDNDE